MGLRIPPLSIKMMLESNPLKPTMLVGRLGVRGSDSGHLADWGVPAGSRADSASGACLGSSSSFSSSSSSTTTTTTTKVRRAVVSAQAARLPGDYSIIMSTITMIIVIAILLIAILLVAVVKQ